jgi:hypothetical protein
VVLFKQSPHLLLLFRSQLQVFPKPGKFLVDRLWRMDMPKLTRWLLRPIVLGNGSAGHPEHQRYSTCKREKLSSHQPSLLENPRRNPSRASDVNGRAIPKQVAPGAVFAYQITEFIRDTESTLLFNHSSGVYYFGALADYRRGLKFDAEFLYIGAMFHDISLVPCYSSDTDRFAVDRANAARDFLRRHNISEHDIDNVWTAIAFTPRPASLSTCIRSQGLLCVASALRAPRRRASWGRALSSVS